VELLLSKRPNIQITESVVLAATRNWASSGKRNGVLKALLTKNAAVKVTEQILMAAVRNTINGKEILEVLLARNAIVKVTEKVLMAATSTMHGEEIMKIPLDLGPNIEITRRF
jgi:hypothetical protein